MNLFQSFRVVLGIVLVVCVAIFVALTWHWPFVGDAALMHYVVFLMRHGFAPYRDIVDINMPGTYFVSWAVSHIYGSSALGFRIFDLSLCAIAAAAMIAIAWPFDWLAGAYAAVLLMLLHGRDGVAQSGERDLVMAILLLMAYAFLFHALRKNAPWAMFLFGLCAGAAATIKPTALPFAPVLILLACMTLKHRGLPFAAHLFSGVIGFVVPIAAAFGFLLRKHSLQAFIAIFEGLIPYHASLNHRPLGYLLNHSFSPLAVLLAIWGILLVTERRRVGFERAALLLGVLFGLLSYIAQGKGYPYHRYPLIAFLLVLMEIDFWTALRRPGAPRALGIAGLALGILLIVPVSLWKISHYDWQNQEYTTMIEADLDALGGPKLSGRVQCMDTFAGCIAALDQMQLVQDTGFLYDCYFYAPERSTPAADAVVNKMRGRFWKALQGHAPEVFVISNQLCLNGPTNYRKLNLWPQFEDWLASQLPGIFRENPAPPAALDIRLRAAFWLQNLCPKACLRELLIEGPPLRGSSDAIEMIKTVSWT